MTRRTVYGISFWIFFGAVVCTIASIALPNWVTYHSPSRFNPVQVSYGLFVRCSSVSGECAPFPVAEDCRGYQSMGFCSLWRSTVFFMIFALVIELTTVVAYIIILVGGRGAREVGWKVLAPLLLIISFSQTIAMALVAYSVEHDDRFFIGWELDKSWILCTVSWAVLFLDSLGLLAAVYSLPYEDDYEPIRSD